MFQKIKNALNRAVRNGKEKALTLCVKAKGDLRGNVCGYGSESLNCLRDWACCCS